MRYITTYERFVAGDFPMVCARTGRLATVVVPVATWRESAWMWTLAPTRGFVASLQAGDPRHPTGFLPFATRRSAAWVTARRQGDGTILLRAVHPDFVTAAEQ